MSILEFSRMPRAWAESVSSVSVTVASTPLTSRRRLVDPAQQDHFKGFDFGRLGDEQARYDHLALAIAALLPQVEDWLQRKTEGPNIY